MMFNANENIEFDQNDIMKQIIFLYIYLETSMQKYIFKGNKGIND